MSATKPIDTNVNRGLAWIGIASSLVGVLDLLATLIILNTWISQADYGTATLSIWLYPILDQATDLGLSAAVIQRDDHDDTKISTVFWINLATASLLFGLLVIGAPLFARAVDGPPIVGYMLIAYGTKLLWQNVYFIPAAMMKRELRFKELSVIRIIANLAEFGGKVGFAAAGFGIWCFVLGPLARVLVTGIGAQICHPWKPKLVLKLGEAKEYVTFGLKTSGSQILFYFYTNVDYPIVGYYFGHAALGFYRLAYDIVLDPVRIISNVIVDIAFPAFARLRHTREKLIAQFVSFTKLNLITVMSFSAIVFVSPDDLLRVVFPTYATPATIDGIRILCAVAILRAVSFVVPPMLDGIGRPDRTFTYTLTAAVALPLAFVVGANVLGDELGWVSVAVAWAVGYPIAFAILIFLAIYTLEWSASAYLRAVSGVPMCAAVATLAGFGCRWALGGHPGAVRLILSSLVILFVMGMMLAYTQGLSLRTAKRAMKGDPEPLPEAVLEKPASG